MKIILNNKNARDVYGEPGYLYEGYRYREPVIFPYLNIDNYVNIVFETRSALEYFKKQVARISYPDRSDLYGDV